jgi:hypothetical protein
MLGKNVLMIPNYAFTRNFLFRSGKQSVRAKNSELNALIFKDGIETIVANENVFKTTFSSDVALMGMGKKTIPSNYNYLAVWKDKLANDNIWNNPKYALTMPAHPVAKMKQAVDNLIEESIKNNGSVYIMDIWCLLKKKPYGLLSCTGSIFLMGFLMKDYADCGYYKKDAISIQRRLQLMN